MRILKYILASTILCIAARGLQAQPYIDLLNARYANSPNSGSGNATHNPVKMQYFNFSANLPIRFKKSGDAVLLMPFVENWKFAWPTLPYRNNEVWGYAFPIGYLKQFKQSRFNLMGVFIPRINRENPKPKNNIFQFGGFLLGSFRVKENLVLKAGAYYNQEFFGPFFIPLLGVDWKINERSNLFGTLPNQLVYERKMNNWLYLGGITRFITNSYRLQSFYGNRNQDNRYMRIDENQLGGFVDFYPLRKWVVNLEFGHSVLRKLKQGFSNESISNAINLYPKDNFYLKLSMAYRIRFR